MAPSKKPSNGRPVSPSSTTRKKPPTTSGRTTRSSKKTKGKGSSTADANPSTEHTPPAEGVPTTIHASGATVESLQEVDLQSVLQDNASKTKQVSDLEAKLTLANRAGVARSNSKSAGKKKKFDPTDPTYVVLRDSVKAYVWGTVKFLSSEDQLMRITRFAMKKCEITAWFKDDCKTLSDQGAAFAQENAEFVNGVLNEHRSYCQNQMKTVAIKYLADKELEEMPSEAEFLKIINRDASVDLDLFAWWWDVYMPKATGNNKLWNDCTKYYGNISTHSPPGKPNQPYVTAATEAWGLLLIQNCRTRWPAILTWKKKSNDTLRYVKGGGDRVTKGHQHIDITVHPEFKGIYTLTDSGQAKFGGWTTKGMKKFAEYVSLCKIGRQKMETPALEKKILDKLREENGITELTYEEHLRSQAGKKPPPSPQEEIDNLIDWDEIELMEGV